MTETRTTGPDQFTGATPDNALRNADRAEAGPMLAADGTPLKKSLQRALRAQKIRALLLIAPLLLFVMISFIVPIGQMLWRSVENEIVAETLPNTVARLRDVEIGTDGLPPEDVFEAMYFDLFLAVESKSHTRLGTRLNYEQTGMSSLFRKSGRGLDDLGKDLLKELREVDPDWADGAAWFELMAGAEDAPRAEEVADRAARHVGVLDGSAIRADDGFAPSREIADLLPLTARVYTEMAMFMQFADGEDPAEEKPWETVYAALMRDLETADVASYSGPRAEMLKAAAAAEIAGTPVSFTEAFADIDKDWASSQAWRVIQTHARKITPGYFLNAVDMQLTPEGAAAQPEDKRILLTLFQRTLFMSLVITVSCILLGYPVAWILANLPMRKANLLMILVLLPFWTSLLVRTSAWKVMLQQQGVINDFLVWIGLVDDLNRLVMINNQTGTIIAMTHILLPFMILPMYSVMQTIPPSYLRAAKSLGATNWTAFWRVYFPQSIPGIGAGSILVFILSIGYYITPEIVGGTKGVFISNRIAYHISSSLNWGLAAALGTILLAVVLLLYWCYDKIVGIDNVKLG